LIVTVAPKEHELRKGDVVTFAMSQDSSELVTHRIRRAGPEPGVYTTRGDANKADDPPITFKDIAGRHVFTIPFLGMAMSSLSSPVSAFWMILTIVLLWILIWVVKRILAK
jgi:signal peptidase